MASTAAKKTAKSNPKAAPWQQANPKGDGEHKTLSPQAKAAAKRAAKKAGRSYPNLIDNMHAAAADKKK